ncbi:MAG: hypothetical protein ACYDBQ_08635 [Thermoplasmatota archaeon]
MLRWPFLVALALAGCSAAPGATVDLHLTFDQALSVQTTPAEAGELPGILHVTWAPGTFAVYNQKETDLEHMNLVTPGGIYTSQTGMGWLHHASSDLTRGVLSNRLLLWDLRALVNASRLSTAANATDPALTDAVGDGVLEPTGLDLPFHLALTEGSGRIVWARVESSAGRESPFRFRPAATPFEFPLTTPGAQEAGAVQGKNAAAYSYHIEMVNLTRQYATDHGGTLPSTLDPSTLHLELTLCGCSWPTNAFDGNPISDATASGNFHWTLCTSMKGYYAGYGYDGTILGQSFGCAPKSTPGPTSNLMSR